MRYDSSPRIFNPFTAGLAGSWSRQLPGPWCGAPRRASARSSCHVAVGKPRVCRRDGEGARSGRRAEEWGFVARGVARCGPHRRRRPAPHMRRRGFCRRHSEARPPDLPCLGLSRLVSAYLGLSRLISAFSAKKVGGQVRYAAGIFACLAYVPCEEDRNSAVNVASCATSRRRCAREWMASATLDFACASLRARRTQAMAATGSRSRSRKPASCSAPTSRHASASSRRAERSA